MTYSKLREVRLMPAEHEQLTEIVEAIFDGPDVEK
jgi:hypothetical protein